VREKLFQIGRMQMLDLNDHARGFARLCFVKRPSTICFSGLVLLATSPLVGFDCIADSADLTWGRFSSCRERVGLNGAPFQMYKFRTMRVERILRQRHSVDNRSRPPQDAPWNLAAENES